MAKRTPRSEAEDSATAAAPARPARSRARADRGTDTADQELAPESADTFAATPDSQESTGPSDDEIRRRAYELYLERGGGHGMDFDDWLRAEQELKKR
jgi:hypothetical protein